MKHFINWKKRYNDHIEQGEALLLANEALQSEVQDLLAKIDFLNKDVEGLCQDIDTKDQQIDALLTENHQFGLDARVHAHELENDLEIAKQVAEYWKLQAEANQNLASIYKKLTTL